MNAFDLYATLSLATDAYEKGLADAEEKGKSAAEGITNSTSSGFSKFGSIMGKVGKITAAGFATAGAGVAALTKQSVDAYGQYQQLVGGAELMFGDASNKVLSNANSAFASMQLSQNEYLEQANMFATGLTNALDGDAQAAADLVDMIMSTEADIVAATGQDMELVQNAFNGIMRNNYMMLDNLGLGIKPTKEGMQEVIDKVNEYNEAQGNATNYTIENLADQEAALVQYVEMQGLAGWASKEAGDTITGSVGQVGAAWKNLITSLADPNADLGQKIEDVVTTAKGALTNLMPIISQALTGVGDLIAQFAPIIAEELPPLIESVLPSLLNAASSLILGVVKALPSLMSVLSTTLPMLLKTAIPSLLQALPDIVQAAIVLISALAEGISDALPVLIPAVVDCVLQIATILTEPSNVELLSTAFYQLIEGLIIGWALAIPDILAQVPTLIEQLITSFGESFPILVNAILVGLGDLFTAMTEKVMGYFGESQNTFKSWIADMISDATDFFANIADIFLLGCEAVVEFGVKLWDDLTTFFTGGMDGITSLTSTGLDNLGELFSGIWETIKTTVKSGIDAVLGLFDFEWSLPPLKVPHLSITGGEAPYGFGGKGSLPSIDIEWYKKAYNDAYILNSPTIFGLSGGKLMAGGEGTGSEAIVGTDLLVDMMRQAVAEGGTPTINVQVFVAGEETDAFVVQSNQRNALISGGRG